MLPQPDPLPAGLVPPLDASEVLEWLDANSSQGPT